jgi:hypothetical protein
MEQDKRFTQFHVTGLSGIEFVDDEHAGQDQHAHCHQQVPMLPKKTHGPCLRQTPPARKRVRKVARAHPPSTHVLVPVASLALSALASETSRYTRLSPLRAVTVSYACRRAVKISFAVPHVPNKNSVDRSAF